MKIKITRQTMSSWKERVRELGPEAEFIDVPGTLPGVKYRGVYTNTFKREAIVAWPVDRSPEAQEAFAKEFCYGAEPVDEMEREVDRKGLSIVEEVE